MVNSSEGLVSTPVTIITTDAERNGDLLMSTGNHIPKVNPDFVLVWNHTDTNANSEEAFQKRSIFEYNLEEEGLILQWETSETDSQLHALKIWAPLDVLKRYSEILKVRLPMKPMADDAKCNPSQITSEESLSTLKKSSLSTISDTIISCWQNFTKNLSLEVDPEVFPEKCRRLTGVYSRDKEYLFDVDESNMYEIFSIAMRSRIVQYILKRQPYKREEQLERDDFAFGYERLVQKKVYEAGYPLHDGTLNARRPGSTRKLLCDHWAKLSYCFKHQPLDTVKDYFGVNIALYFAWLGYYTGMLGFASVFGLVCFIYGAASIVSDHYVNDICNATSDIKMCPMCDTVCPFWNLSDKCTYSKIAHLFDNDFSIAFSLSMSIWTAFFLEYWKRYSAHITYRWDLTSFDVRDFTPRPEYVAELKRIYPKHKRQKKSGFIHGSRNAKESQPGAGAEQETRKYDFELTIPFWQRKLPFRLLSYSSVILMVLLAFITIVGVIMYRLWFTFWLSKIRRSDNGPNLAWERMLVSFTAAMLNLTFIVIFGKVYKKLAAKLTEMEMPRTQTEFDASYTLKVYLLQFVNNYCSIFYVAFFKGAYAGGPHKYHKLFGVLRQEECGISCMPELCIQLVVIMVGKQAKSMLQESLIPWCTRSIKRNYSRLKGSVMHVGADDSLGHRRSATHKKYSQWMEDYDLLEWGPYLLTEEYLEMVLQFGLVTIFVTAFPLAPLLALINNLLELRIDANKLVRHYRRPIGIRVKDIGVWSNIVDGITKVAILSNACIIALTSNFIPKFMYRYVLQDKGSPNYGSLNGYLNSSLTVYDINDLEAKPDLALIKDSTRVCHFATYRHDYTEGAKKYDFRLDHWQIWLARVVFIIIYENVVAVMVFLLRWVIPDIPGDLLQKMQREQRLVNELVLKHEMNRHRKSMSEQGTSLRSANTIQQIQQDMVNQSKDREASSGGSRQLKPNIV